MEWLSASAASQLLVSLLAVFVLGRAKGGADAPGAGLLRMVWGATAGFRPLALCAKLAIVSAPLPPALRCVRLTLSRLALPRDS